MGITYTHHVIIGDRLPEDFDVWEETDPDHDKYFNPDDKGCYIIVDSMGGQGNYIGVDLVPPADDDSEPTSIPLDGLQRGFVFIKALDVEKYAYREFGLRINPQLISFTHAG